MCHAGNYLSGRIVRVMPTFKKVQFKKKSAFVTEQIADAIKRGTFTLGAKLPSERQLAESMGVSRPLVREALSGLQLTGIVESRTGDGTYVTQTIDNLDEAYLVFTSVKERRSLREAYEVRCVLEQGIAIIACKKATIDGLDKLNQCLQALSVAASNQDFEEFNRANHCFHLALAQATHNSLFVRVLESLLGIMHQTIPKRLLKSLYWCSKERFNESLALHQKLYDALQVRDQQKVTQAILHHFYVISRDISD